MADNTNPTTPTAPTAGSTPATGGINWDEYQKKINEAAARTRDVQGVSSAEKSQLQTAANKVLGMNSLAPFQQTAKSLVSGLDRQETALKSQAERAASALEMVGESTKQGIQNLENIQGTIRGQVQSASDSFGAAAEKADEYVKAARGRVTEVLGKLDTIFNDIQTTRDFSKAHSMQASVQAVLGSMKTEERNIVENYGTDSKEYAQFQQSKMGSLATIQSNIHSSYAQLEEQQKTNYLNAVSDAYTKSNMYLGFQEQQHVEMLKYQDDSRASYALKGAELDATLEQMKMAGMENLANWIVETPTFTMDTTPIVTAISELAATSQSLYTAWKMRNNGEGGGGILGQVLGTAAGSMFGGIGSAIGGKVGSMITREK